MDISKTIFKDLVYCNRIYSLSNIKKFKYSSSYELELIKEELKKMYNEDGDDLVDITDEQLEVMLPYYNKCEEIALLEASKYFNKKFDYFHNTLDQKCFSFNDGKGNNIYTYVDGYYEDDNTITIIEVKSTTDRKYKNFGPMENKKVDPIFICKNKELIIKDDLSLKQNNYLNNLLNKNNDCGKYLYDLAVTNYIVKNSLKTNKKVDYYLAILNSDYIFDGSYVLGNPHYYDGLDNLFTFINANDIVSKYYESICLEHSMIIDILSRNDLPLREFDSKCNNCRFRKVCFPEFNNLNTLDRLLKSKYVNKVHYSKYINNNIFYINELDSKLLKDDQLIQYNVINGHDFVNKEELVSAINDKIKYPLYHLDFESFNGPLPRFAFEKPYSQSVFQFSLHIQKAPFCCDRYKDNYYYLPNDFLDHREDLIKTMISLIDLKNGGTVIVWNDSFEKNRIKELACMFPKYKDDLMRIYDAIYDLKKLIYGEKGELVKYYSEKQNGSYSIKKVLPCFTNLSYKELEIHNGVEAVCNYSKFRFMDNLDIEEVRSNLIKYCGLDTYSMVAILNGMLEMIK